jgi:hypothetical protein
VLAAIAEHDVRIAAKPVNADHLMRLVNGRYAQAVAE